MLQWSINVAQFINGMNNRYEDRLKLIHDNINYINEVMDKNSTNGIAVPKDITMTQNRLDNIKDTEMNFRDNLGTTGSDNIKGLKIEITAYMSHYGVSKKELLEFIKRNTKEKMNINKNHASKLKEILDGLNVLYNRISSAESKNKISTNIATDLRNRVSDLKHSTTILMHIHKLNIDAYNVFIETLKKVDNAIK